MRITIEISEATKAKFSSIKLGYTNFDGLESKVELNIRKFTDAFDYTENDLNSVKFDFFFISSIIHGIDDLLDREKYSIDGWAREIEVEIPVCNLSNFNGKESILEEALNFLTGDFWTISFSQNQTSQIFWRNRVQRNNFINYEREKVKSVSLFSGGLDSLIGVIDILETLQNDEKILFVSHFDYKSSGTNKAQNDVLTILKTKYPEKIYWIQTKIALSRKDNFQNKIVVDGNYRSRSLLFIGLGTYLSNTNQLVIPENGTISINYPLTPSRVSSLSTRTTHPYVIAKLQEFITAIGIELTIINPYSLLTKGEMVSKSLDRTNVLNAVFSYSVSCGKKPRNRNRYNSNRLANQCGVCMPCIYRRASLNKANLDSDNDYFNDILKAASLNDFPDMKALFSFLKRNITKEQMMTDLVVNSSINPDDLDAYAELVLRSRQEVLQLFRDKGNTFVKTELGLI